MIKFRYTDLVKVMDLSREAADYVNLHFKDPINLEFEKAYSPYLLIGKKRYAGLYWTSPTRSTSRASISYGAIDAAWCRTS